MSNRTLDFEDLFDDDKELGILNISAKTNIGKSVVVKKKQKPVSKPSIKSPIKVKAKVKSPSISKPKVTVTVKPKMPAQAIAAKAKAGVGTGILASIKNAAKPVADLSKLANLGPVFLTKPKAKTTTATAKPASARQLQYKQSSIPLKIGILKEQVKTIKKIPSKVVEKKVAKAASTISKLSNKPKQQIVADMAVEAKPFTPDKQSDVVKLGVEESLGLPGFKAIVASPDVSTDTKHGIINSLNRVADIIVGDRNEAFRRNVLAKLKSIDYKISKGTLAYQGSFLV